MLQDTGAVASQAAGGDENIALNQMTQKDDPDIESVIPLADADNGVLCRIGYNGASTPPIIQINTPATVGGIPLYYFGRGFHSAIQPYDPATPYTVDTPFWFYDVIDVPAATEVTVPHSLAAEPDMLFVHPTRGGIAQGLNWAVTEISATQFKVRNWDAAEALQVAIKAYRVHSIQIPVNTFVVPAPVTLTGAAPVAVPHGLSAIPDMISVFPYELGGVEPTGLVIMDSPPDDTNIYLRNDAAGDLACKLYAQATHSIQL